MYEFYYTRNQSAGSLTTDGSDNYFHNHLYRSGWTYESRILGVPFVTLNDTRSGIANNKFIVHHIGLSGIALNNFPYKLLASYRKNYGGKGTAYIPNDVFSTYLDVRVLQAYVDFNVQLGGDFSSDEGSNLGIGLNLSKNLF